MKRIEELKELLKLVDMVNGFTMKGDPQDSYNNEESSVFDNYPSHCLQATDEEELIDKLKPLVTTEYERNFANAMCYHELLNDINMITASTENNLLRLLENSNVIGCKDAFINHREEESPVYKKTTYDCFVPILQDTFETKENIVLTLKGGNNEKVR